MFFIRKWKNMQSDECKIMYERKIRELPQKNIFDNIDACVDCMFCFQQNALLTLVQSLKQEVHMVMKNISLGHRTKVNYL